AVAALNTVPIEAVALGRRTLGENPELSDAERAAFVDPDPATWRELRFRMTKADGGGLDVHLLRPLDWIAAAGAAVGRTVHLDLAELGADGPAECLSIGPCPEIEPGAGNVVTGLFRHHSVSNLLDLSVEGDPTPTGVTASHPYWSVDREAFIPAGDLQIGERLRRADGSTAAVLRLTPRPDEPVFNLEVHGEHVFRVGDGGLLVHNAYSSTSGNNAQSHIGRLMHAAYNPGPNYSLNKALKSGRRPDAVDHVDRIVRELKPNNPKAIRRGERQLKKYIDDLKSEFGGDWIGIVDTY
ncbi:MAG: hypothetical protein ACRC1K_02525, partial [Planctomycetia bacterium]